MKKVYLELRRKEMQHFKNQAAPELEQGRQVIEPDTLVYDKATGDLLIAHVDLAGERYPADLLGAVQRLRYDTTFRTAGLKTTSRVFGFQPRITMRRDFCTTTQTAREHPQEHGVLCAWGERLTKEYATVNPTRYRRQQNALANVKSCWRIPGSLFTSGIVNWNNQLAYHRDQGNFPDLWSFMVVLSRDLEGGMLAVPELNVALRYSGAQYSAFDGANLIHGVTPIRKRGTAAYRYSVVWYALAGMCKCGTPEEELARIRRVKTEREVKRGEKR